MQAEPATLHGRSMGTFWSARACLPPGLATDTAAAGIQRQLDRVEAQMSTYRADSDLCRFNRAPAGVWQRLPTEFYTVLRHALWLARESGGAYDPTVGALVDAWGFGPTAVPTQAPSPARIEALRARAGWPHVELDDASQSARRHGDVALDLSSIAKGYAVDLAGAWLGASGVSSWLVEVGGELKTRGTKPGGTPWRVGIERADASGELLLALPLTDGAMATSGDYRRGYESAGHRVSHHVDPRSGRPLASDVASATVVAAHALHADPLGTTLRVLGIERGMAFARERRLAVLLQERVGSGLRVHRSPAMAALLREG